jgi:glycosyltransferase involved in cell wall biosynthesis
MNAPEKPRIAFWFRYGPAEHTILFHCIPQIIELLARDCTVHYYGMRGARPIPESIRRNARLHLLPLFVNRTNTADKIIKTMLWLLLLPLIGLHCRLQKIDAVYIDETIPLTAGLARLFFGKRVALTVTDFFMNIYAGRTPVLRPLCKLVNHLDMAAWRKLPLIFTRAKATRDFLEKCGVPPGNIFPVYDPCDLSIYHPADKAECRKAFGFGPGEIVLVHHGILHPNKGNDRIIAAMPALLEKCPQLRLLLVGDGPELPRLKQMAAENKLEKHVTFTGWLKELPEVNRALNAGDIGLVMRSGLATDHFAMTGALIHAMACGLPILAVRLRSIEEVIRDGQNGFLFDPENMDEFGEKLLRLARDPALRGAFSQQTLNAARALFDMHTVARQTAEPLLNLCKLNRQ